MQINTNPIVRNLAALELIAARPISDEFTAKVKTEARSVARGAALVTGLHTDDYLAAAGDWIAAAAQEGADPAQWDAPAGWVAARLTCHASLRAQRVGK